MNWAMMLYRRKQEIKKLKVKVAVLEAKLEAHDHLLECKRGWQWDLNRRGLDIVEAVLHMIACNKAAAQEEKKQ